MFKNTFCSDTVANIYTNNIIEPSFKGISTTIIGFPGAGKTLELSEIFKNAKYLPNYNHKYLFSIIDIGLLDTQESNAFLQVLSFIQDYFSDEISVELKTLLNTYNSVSNINLKQFLEFLSKAVTLGYSFTFGVDSVNRILVGGNNSSKLQNLLSSIRSVNTAKITYVFLCLREFDNNMLKNMHSLLAPFTQNIILGRELLLDNQGLERVLKYNEDQLHFRITKGFMDKLNTWCYGDPTLLHVFINKAKVDPSFENTFINLENIEELKEDIKDSINHRYNKVLSNLLPETIEQFKNFNGYLENPSDYLINSGLFIKNKNNKNNKYEPLNPVFDYYLKNLDFKDITSKKDIKNNNADINTNNILSKLSGQELIIFNLLRDNQGNVVSREDIAKLMWEDNWEDKYSDWAIDQLVSRIRSKLLNTKYSLKTLKGKGFMLLDTLNS